MRQSDEQGALSGLRHPTAVLVLDDSKPVLFTLLRCFKILHISFDSVERFKVILQDL